MAKMDENMTEAELAAFHEAHMDDEILWKKPPRTIRSRRGKGPSVAFSIRLTGEELTRISQAAFAQGTNPSDFIRSAALRALDQSDEERQRHQKAVDEVRSKIEELQDAIARL